MPEESTASTPALDLLVHGRWQMVPGERAALEGVLGYLKPQLAIEIGTAQGGSLRRVAEHSAEVHSFDLEHGPDVPDLPGVHFHSGDSHVLLPEILRGLENDSRNVDFVLVDGDHSAAGARRDVEDLLSSGAIRRTVILAHDACNEEVREGLEAVDYGLYDKVVFVDLDFIGGHVSASGFFANQIWGGFAIIVVDDEATTTVPTHPHGDMHSAFDVLRRGLESDAIPSVRDSRPSPEPALPWTEALPARVGSRTRMRAQMAWERLPRREDLRHPASYARGLLLHRKLFHAGHTMLYPVRGRTLYRLVQHADRLGIPGALVDCGAWNGGSTALMAAAAPSREVWAFDAFQKRTHASEQVLRDVVGGVAPSARLHVHAGWFKVTLPAHATEIGQIAVLHCDTGPYESVLTSLEVLYPHVSPGGWIVIDDYGSSPPAGEATRDFRRRIGDTAPLVRVDQTGRYWRKPV